MTQPTWRRSQLEREAMSTAVAMKYSSHEGRCGKLPAASAIKSTGRTGTGGTAGVSGLCAEETERLMNEVRTLDSERRSGNLRLIVRTSLFPSHADPSPICTV